MASRVKMELEMLLVIFSSHANEPSTPLLAHAPDTFAPVAPHLVERAMHQ